MRNLYCFGLGVVFLIAGGGCGVKATAKQDSRLGEAMRKQTKLSDLTPDERKRVEPFLNMSRENQAKTVPEAGKKQK